MTTKIFQTAICVIALTLGLATLGGNSVHGFIKLFDSIVNGNAWHIVYWFLLILIFLTPMWMCFKGTKLLFNASRSDKTWIKIVLWISRLTLFILGFIFFYVGIIIALIGIWLIK